MWEFLDATKMLFASKEYEETWISDIMDMAGGAKEMFYHIFQSKEDDMHALGNQMFFENNPFDAIKMVQPLYLRGYYLLPQSRLLFFRH